MELKEIFEDLDINKQKYLGKQELQELMKLLMQEGMIESISE